MKLVIDNADINEIKRICEFYPVDGVTTNPSIIAKSKRDPYEVLKEIRAFIGKDMELHAQVISSKAEDMAEEGRCIVKALGANTYVKIPSTVEGLKAIRILRQEGILVTATAIYSKMQAFLAAKAGAQYVAPYVNRIDNLGSNGIGTVKEIHDMLKRNHLDTEVLAASFKNSFQVQELCEYGVGAATIDPAVIDSLIKNDSVSAALDVFVNEFEGLCGEGKTMNNKGI